MQVLLLGGTGEATRLGRQLAGHTTLATTLSLAGRTRSQDTLPLPTRIGGFGGANGLAEYLRGYGVDAVVDATHPFARRITSNAAAASRAAGIPLAILSRPPWEPIPGDQWIRVPDLSAAAAKAAALGEVILVTTGRQHLAPFEAHPDKHYIIRTIDPPQPRPLLPNVVYIQARGPFSRADEAALMAQHAVDVLVSKASGGEATRAKLDAARDRRIPVVMAERPPLPAGIPVYHHPEPVVRWLESLAESGCHGSSPYHRGV